MLKEMLGIRSGILEDLHRDHVEVDELFEHILSGRSNGHRADLFKTLKAKLTAHAEAEDKVLYRKLARSKNKDVRKFPREGSVEHEIVEEQLQILARSRSKDSEEWTGRLTVLRELVRHHVKEEESEGFAKTREEFNSEQIDDLGRDFQKEKQKLLGETVAAPPGEGDRRNSKGPPLLRN
jgi:hypothetical protein